MNLSSVRQRAERKPARVVVLAPSAYADSWTDKPTAEVAVGLRLLSEKELQTAKAEASRYVEKAFASKAGDGTHDTPKSVEAWNDTLIRWAVAYGTCDPNDVTAPFLPYAEDTIALAFTSATIRFLWDQIDRLHAELGALAPVLEDDELEAFIALLPKLATLPAAKALRFRRLLGFCRDELAALP